MCDRPPLEQFHAPPGMGRWLQTFYLLANHNVNCYEHVVVLDTKRRLVCWQAAPAASHKVASTVSFRAVLDNVIGADQLGDSLYIGCADGDGVQLYHWHRQNATPYKMQRIAQQGSRLLHGALKGEHAGHSGNLLALKTGPSRWRRRTGGEAGPARPSVCRGGPVAGTAQESAGTGDALAMGRGSGHARPAERSGGSHLAIAGAAGQGAGMAAGRRAHGGRAGHACPPQKAGLAASQPGRQRSGRAAAARRRQRRRRAAAHAPGHGIAGAVAAFARHPTRGGGTHAPLAGRPHGRTYRIRQEGNDQAAVTVRRRRPAGRSVGIDPACHGAAPGAAQAPQAAAGASGRTRPVDDP
ncbi:hypothetical protein OSTOST_14419 [Ostertagia ostertagi]